MTPSSYIAVSWDETVLASDGVLGDMLRKLKSFSEQKKEIEKMVHKSGRELTPDSLPYYSTFTLDYNELGVCVTIITGAYSTMKEFGQRLQSTRVHADWRQCEKRLHVVSQILDEEMSILREARQESNNLPLHMPKDQVLANRLAEQRRTAIQSFRESVVISHHVVSA
jgi:hypothetical protein